MKLKILSYLLVGMVLTGCESWLDINHDPNNLSDLPSESLLIPAAEVTIATQVGGSYLNLGGFWAQYYTQGTEANQYKGIDGYSNQKFQDPYQDMYAGALNDLQGVKEMALKKENWGNYLVATSLEAYTMQLLLDLYGDLPYSEAFQGDQGLTSPVFDEAKETYGVLIAALDEALSKPLDAPSSVIDEQTDMIYGGDIEQWKRFANSVKLKLMMRPSYAGEYNNGTVKAFVEANQFITKDAEITAFIDQANKANPWYATHSAYGVGADINHCGSKTFVNYLSDNQDPRLKTIYKEAKNGGYKGNWQGDYNVDGDFDGNGTNDKERDEYCSVNIGATHPAVLMMVSEINFYIAEVYARAGENAQAQAYYEAGVIASLEKHGIVDQTILGNYAEWKPLTGDVEADIRQIMMQKWVAFANYNNIEGFLERTRTKYPEVSSIMIGDGSNQKSREEALAAYVDGEVGKFITSIEGQAILNGKLPASLLYPDKELDRNENAPSQKRDIAERVWWDKQNERN